MADEKLVQQIREKGGAQALLGWRKENPHQTPNLTGANLYRANLKGADLSRANLSGADLGYANLSEANLTDTILLGANVAGADFSGATFWRQPHEQVAR